MEMMNISNTFSSAACFPSHTCGESEARGAQQAGREGVFGLPGVARRLVTFFVLPKKITKKSRPQSAIPAGFPVLLGWSGGCGNQSSPISPDQPALLGGETGEGNPNPQNFIRRVGKLPTNYQIAAWAPCAHPTGVERDLIL